MRAFDLVAEEQPQENDHRDWHTQQPKQNSFTHRRPPRFLICRGNAAARGWFRVPITMDD
jgi:hypothetical protein